MDDILIRLLEAAQMENDVTIGLPEPLPNHGTR